MPKGRKSKVISEDYEVQKCRPMFYDLWKQKDKENISMMEYKILDTYMSMINSHQISSRDVIIDVSHLNDTFKSNYTKSDLLNLFARVLRLVIRVSDDEIIALFSAAKVIKNKNEEMQVLLTCSDEAQSYFFNLDSVGYYHYKLKSTLALDSVYSYLLFNYLELNRFRTAFEISVDELKKLLRCDGVSYSSFKVFNDRVLKHCFKEITSKTECKFSYKTIKSGRYVTDISFEVEPLKSDIIIQNTSDAVETAYPVPEQQHQEYKQKKLLISRMTSQGCSERDAEKIYLKAVNDMELYKLTSEIKNEVAYLVSRIDKYVEQLSKSSDSSTSSDDDWDDWVMQVSPSFQGRNRK